MLKPHCPETRSSAAIDNIGHDIGKIGMAGWYMYGSKHRLLTGLSISQGTSDVRLDPQLNKKVWEQGVKGVPYRLRVRISRRRNDEEGAKEKLYSYVQAVNVKNPKGLVTTTVEEEEQ